MENIQIVVVSDNREGKRIAQGFQEVGADVVESSLKDLYKFQESAREQIVLAVNLDKPAYPDVLKSLQKLPQCAQWLKFIFIKAGLLKNIDYSAVDSRTLEFLQRPVRISEFLIIVEKSLLAERFRNTLQSHSQSKPAEKESLQNLYDLFRKKIFIEDDRGPEQVFEKILNMQKKLDDEHLRYQKAIEKFSVAKQKNLFVEQPAASGQLLEILKAQDSAAQLDREIIDEFDRLQDENERLEEALVKAQMRILDLEQKQLGQK